MKLSPETEVSPLVHRILHAAGFQEGRFQARGVRGEYYDPPVSGFKVDLVQTYVPMTRQEEQERKRHGFPGHPNWSTGGWRVDWITVDHVGKGQKAAVQKYAAVLRQNGLVTTVQVPHSYQKKTVAIVEVPLHFYDSHPNMMLVERGLRFAPWP